MNKIAELGPHTRMTVEEALALSLRQAEEFQCVLIIGWGHDGEYMHRSANLTRGDAAWLVDAAKLDILTKDCPMQGAGSLYRGKTDEENPHQTEQAGIVALCPRSAAVKKDSSGQDGKG